MNINGGSAFDLFSIFFGQFYLYLFLGLLVLANEKRGNKYGFLKHLITFLLLLSSIVMIIDHVFFKILGATLNFSFSEGIELSDFRLFIDSGLSELNYSLGLCLLILLAGILYILKSIYYPFQEKVIHIIVWPIILSFLISIPFAFIDHRNGIDQFPLVRILIDFDNIERTNHQISNVDYKHEEISSLIYGKPIKEKSIIATNYQEKLRSSKKNIVLFIIESVGSVQIAEDGKIKKEITPNLYKLKDKSILFNNIYNIFPGTTRSHIPITTGGRSMTWSSVNRELLQRFTGMTTAKFFNNHNYQTGLFSGMNLGFENLNFFYKNLGFKHVFDPDDETSDFKNKYKVHSWGVDEKIVFSKALDWMANQKKPVYMQILTNTTHHPYGVPRHFKSKLPGDTKYQRYLQALNYTDKRIGEFISTLKTSGKLKNTLIFITGDHGQAFSRRHEDNWTHKNFVYEENIRNFLLLIDASKRSEFILANKKGYIGDILPTMASFITDKKLDVLGDNLISNQYKPKLIFFHKNTHPELWGLIDGDYKFIASRMHKVTPELFNLSKDNKEKNNIIELHKEKIPTYTKKIKAWYLKLNHQFTSHLDGFVDSTSMEYDDLIGFGPKKIHFGINIFGEEFKTLSIINPYEDMSVWTQGISYPKDTVIKYEFISPKGQKRLINFKYKKGWSSVKIFHHSKTPMEEGSWKVNLYDNNKILLSGEFTVSFKASLNIDLFSKKAKIHYISFGSRKSDKKFIKLKQIHPNEDMEVQLLLKPYPINTKLFFKWIGPTGNINQFHFFIKKGWSKAWVFHSAKKIMEEGEWQLIILDNEKKELIKKYFYVSKNAILLVPDQY